MGAKQIHRLNALKITKETAPGYYADGGGLYLQISSSGSRSWIFRFTLAKRGREMGLGSLSAISLAEARAQATACRKLLAEGVDPIEARNADRERAAGANTDGLTFRQAATDFIAMNRASWKNKKHAEQWDRTLAAYVFPVIGAKDVSEIDTAMVVRILQPIWTTKAETAGRVRGRIEAVLDAAKAIGKRSGENPARWRGHLAQILPKRNRRRHVVHHPALPFADMHEFMVKLRADKGMASRVLELLVLTGVRTTEALHARPEEFDLARRIWTVPPERMKMEKELRVPLSDQAMVIVRKAMETAQKGGYLFPGRDGRKPMAHGLMLILLNRLGYSDFTVHGFRSTFRDWVAECTEYPGELAEMALAHAIESKVEGAYRRGDMLERRRRMMQDWADFCAGKTATVLPFTPPQSQAAV